ncbi:Imm32 family immunity protein [Actinoplanes xinjiangensis]|uniref:Imm32 family immunity protein n=1 Tax=Actinoplanes xinjiangensis TaxID=512350 RepID=UPI003F4E0055
MCFSGGSDFLDIIWDALDGVAEQAMTAEDRSINRHQHIEYFPGDEYRSPNSVPLVIVADGPEQPEQGPLRQAPSHARCASRSRHLREAPEVLARWDSELQAVVAWPWQRSAQRPRAQGQHRGGAAAVGRT